MMAQSTPEIKASNPNQQRADVVRRRKRIWIPQGNSIRSNKCFKCGQESVFQKEHELTWESTASTAVGLLAPVPMTRITWKAKVTVGLCRKHRIRFLLWTFLPILGLILLPVGGIMLISYGQLLSGVIMIMGTFLLPVAALIFGRVITATHCSEEGIEIAGAGRGFLDTLVSAEQS